jgi:Zn-dependent peptidase ImmA (M78 family)/transcriptional regulator with XRE-family HTH domain
MIGTPGFVGARLVQARKARGLSSIALAEMIGLKSAVTISQYEHGKHSPPPEVLDAISQKLNRPRSFFLRPVRKRDQDGRWYRSFSAATKAARERAEVRFDWLRDLTDYLRGFLDFPRVNLPNVGHFDRVEIITTDQIEDAAKTAREFWMLGDGPVADVALLLENNGVIVSRGELGSENLDAFSQWPEDDDRPYVFLGADKGSAVRSRFDGLHELGHILLHRHVDRRVLRKSDTYRQMEQQCHRFALAFLLPPERFSKDLWSPTLNSFLALKPHWKVAIQAMVIRCEQLGILPEDHKLWINIGRRGWRKKEPYDDEFRPEMPRLLRRSIEMLIENGIKTKEQILVDLATTSPDLEPLACLPPGYLEWSDQKILRFRN